MKHIIVVGLVSEDYKAVLKGNDKAKPGYGSTQDAAVGDLITENSPLFDMDVVAGNPNGPEAR